jgi:hypothetical protein
LCKFCREVQFEAGLSWCGLHQRDWPDAVQCGRYQPDSGPEGIPPQVVVSAEFGTGIAFAEYAQ